MYYKTLLSPKNLHAGTFVLVKFPDIDFHHEKFYYMEIGIIRKDMMQESGNKLECLILTDARFAVDDPPKFSATPHPPFLVHPTQVIEIDKHPLYEIDSTLVEKLLNQQQECLKTALQAAQAEFNGFGDFRESLKRVRNTP